ncbi:MAG: 8-amino-7-oxononanoate synthase [Proteobacteria bacterium]|nr:8-amino-7-oxononanoate synthase [Pseudomonadota bacterium]
MNKIETDITEELARLKDAGLRRVLKSIESAQGPRVRVKDAGSSKEQLLLCSNDYLGLANHPAIKEALSRGVDEYGVGAGASRLVSGTMAPHRCLEECIKDFFSAEAALLFNSGYNANLGVITALAGRGTEIFSDRLNHASIVDGCILSRAKVHRYSGVESLERKLKSSKTERRLIITEGLFSMDGNFAPLPELLGLAKKYGATLILDDAHAVGALGEYGRGTPEMLGIEAPDIIRVGTFGKAFGTFGAFVTGSSEMIELLVSKSRPFIYTTALPPALAYASLKSLELVIAGTELRARLEENRAQMSQGLKTAGIDTLESESHIIPVIVGSAAKSTEVSRTLENSGLFIQAIRPPTVPEGTSRLRVTLSAAHTKEELSIALGAITSAVDSSLTDKKGA